MVRRLTDCEVGIGDRKRDLALERPHVALESLGNHDRLLENLLLHEVAVIALLDRRRRSAGLDDLALDRLVVAVEDLDAFAADDGPVALVEIGDALGPRRDRKRVRAEVILAVAIADGQRRTHARADHQVGMVAEQEGDGERAVEPRQAPRRRRPRAMRRARSRGRPDGRPLRVSVSLSKVRPSPISSSRSGLKFSMMPLWTSATGPTMCGWALPTVGAPCVAQRVWAMPVVAVQRIGLQLPREIVELALGPPPHQLAMIDGADAGPVIAAIFEPLQPVEQPPRDIASSLRSRQFRTFRIFQLLLAWPCARGSGGPSRRCPSARCARSRGCRLRRRG